MSAFATPQEAATYTMLKQVCQNHVTLHRMSLLAAVMAGVGLLGERSIMRCREEAVPSVVVAQLLSQLKHRMRARQTTPGFVPFVAESAQDAATQLGEHARRLYDALSQLLHESEAAWRLESEGGRRVVLGLMADLLSMLLHQFDQTLDEVDAFIDAVVGPSLESYLKTHVSLPPPGDHG